MVEYYRVPPTVLMPFSVTEVNRHTTSPCKGAALADLISFANKKSRDRISCDISASRLSQ